MSLLQPSAAPGANDIAYNWLRDAVCALPWDQEVFLSEAAIAEASGTSRTPVRDALTRLTAAGMVRRVPHKGAFVPALTAADVEKMMEARQVIEEWAVRKAVGSSALVAELYALLDAQSHASEPTAFIEGDIAFHRRIVAAGENAVLREVYDSQRMLQLRMGVRAVVDSTGRSDHVIDEHRAIVDALATGDPEIAVRAVREHLEATIATLQDVLRARDWLPASQVTL